ncbi:diguanylate cyclase domain-containing protein [Brevibacillus migulae]|uniref:diguanylate cyclase domain-containing protein n=1 Tax=Brevibacillus migulae TaxID=1644114 RepID=UPI00106E7C4C|nr:diguanylate cyclase [Brevibacillus migulae]
MSTLDLTELIQEYGQVLSRFFDPISDMIFLMAVEDESTFRYVMMNPSAMRVAGLTEEAYGKTFEEVYPPEKANRMNHQYREAVRSRKPFSFIDEEDICGESVLTPIFNSVGICTHVFSVTRDITERKRLEDQLHYMAYHDMLTELPNRRKLYDLIDDALKQTQENRKMLAVMYLDCDDFKKINDTLGHEAGDEFLRGLSKRLRYCVRDTDILSRFGGDEFVIILPDIANEEEVARIAERIIHSLGQPWLIKQQQLSVTVSVGISLYPRDGQEKYELIGRADEALYQAKDLGRNRYKLYSQPK